MDGAQDFVYNKKKEEIKTKAILLPGEILSLTTEAANRLIQAGSPDAALLYLWLLRSGGIYRPAQAIRDLKWEMPRLQAAMDQLALLELAAPFQKQAPVSEKLAAADPPEYSAADINQELQDQTSPFPKLVTEVQKRLGKVLPDSDLKALFTIYDYVDLPAEVILMLVSWCVEEYQRKYHTKRFPRVQNILKEASRWKENGVDTVETAEDYLKNQIHLRAQTSRILSLLHISDRPAIEKEQNYIASWLNMGFSEEAIQMAYERTVLKKTTMNWPYMNSILTNWHRKGFHSEAQIAAGEKKGRSTKAGGSASPKRTPPGEADLRAKENMERLRIFLREQGKEV